MTRQAPRILIIRTDSIGDVMLTLPMCGWIKRHLPASVIHFLGRTYTEPIIQHCSHVDAFINADELSAVEEQRQIAQLSQLKFDIAIHVFPVAHWMRISRKAGIPMRIASGHRLSSWRWCSHRVAFSRRRSSLHEAQLNFKLLKPMGLSLPGTVDAIYGLYGFHTLGNTTEKLRIQLSPERINICLHPFSQGSAVEWSLASFQQLVDLFDPQQTHFFITGTSADLVRYKREGEITGSHVTCVMGECSLTELIDFIGAADGLIAASTGPLHIAAALGIPTVGVYSSARPIHPGRWAPLGRFASALEDNGAPRSGALAIPAEDVKQTWERLFQRKKQERS